MKDEDAALRAGDDGHLRTNVPHTPPLFLRVSAFALVVLSVLAACWWGVLRHERAVRREALRQRQIVKSLGVLRRAFPRRVFAVCGADGMPTAFQANFHNVSVRSVTLSRSDGDMKAAVEILGTQTEWQSPTIYVALYDKSGTVLFRSAVVDYRFDTLRKGDDDPDQDKRPHDFETGG